MFPLLWPQAKRVLRARRSVNDRPAAFSKSDSVTYGRINAVVKFIAQLDSHSDAASCGNHDVDASKGLGIWPVETNAIVLVILIHEVDFAGPRRDFDLSRWVRCLVADLNSCRPG